MSYVMWEVKAQWQKVKVCAVKERGNVQAEAEGTCSMPHHEALAGWLEAQAHVWAFVQGNAGMWGMQGQPFRLRRCEHGHLSPRRVHPAVLCLRTASHVYKEYLQTDYDTGSVRNGPGLSQDNPLCLLFVLPYSLLVSQRF